MREPPQSDDEPKLFLDDEAPPAGPGAAPASPREGGNGGLDPALPPWRILIVDDDVDVHVVTKFALSSASFQGRRLSFVHAYSAAEALAKLRSNADIALVLLDVIMETADAGLQLARQVREQLGNDLVRIVLRTGQPGQAVEHSIIVDYDINDFWSKADLTTRKLFTTVIAALRAYATLAQAAAARDSALRRAADSERLLGLAREAAGVIVLNRDGAVIEINQAAAALLGTDPDAALGASARTQDAGALALLLAAVSAGMAAEPAWSGIVELPFAFGMRQLRCAAGMRGDGEVVVFAAAVE